MAENVENEEQMKAWAHEKNPRPHKIPVPTQYRQAAKILKQIVEEGKSFKDLVYNNKHIKTGSTVALLNKIQANESQLDKILGKTEILQKIPNVFLAKILVAELIFGRGQLNGHSKPVECVLSHHEQLKEALAEIGENPNQQSKLQQYKVPRYIRINTIMIKRSEAKEYLEREGWKLIENTFETYEEFLEAVRSLDDESYLADYHIKNLYVFPSSSRRHWATNEMVQEGKFLLQDKASCLPTHLLDPPHKSTVLDMCSAPGGKTTHLASIMKNKGKIYAVEMNPNRYATLVEMIEGTQSTIVQTMNRDVLEVKDEDVPKVEYILLDPSCSGSGMLNRFESEIRNKDSGRLYKLAGLQHKLLTHAMTSFPNVKRIVYSTCSVYPEENEEVVLSCLRKVSDFKLVDAAELMNRKWNNYGSETVYPGIGEKTLYARTAEDLSNGFFVSVLERCDEGEQNEFYLQKRENIQKNKQNEENDKGKVKKRRDRRDVEEVEEKDQEVPEVVIEENGDDPPKKQKKNWKEVPEMVPEGTGDDPPKKQKKKWKNKGYNQ